MSLVLQLSVLSGSTPVPPCSGALLIGSVVLESKVR